MKRSSRRLLLERSWQLARWAVTGALGWFGATWLRGGLSSARAAPPAQHPLRPPGALAEELFRQRCTHCFLCGQVCDSGAIQFPWRIVAAQPEMRMPPDARTEEPRAPEWHGRETPYVLPWEIGCDLCMKCGAICPTGALVPISAERDAIKQQVRMGVARIDRKICLPWTRRSWCGACHTACPFRNEAITVDYQNRPTVHPEHCTGCGLCVEVCPIRYKAIAVIPPFSPDVGRVRAE